MERDSDYASPAPRARGAARCRQGKLPVAALDRVVFSVCAIVIVIIIIIITIIIIIIIIIIKVNKLPVAAPDRVVFRCTCR